MKLLFVYNADAGLFSMVTDFAHKLLKSETYACNLCMLTYGSVKMKKEWKEFVESLHREVVFLHRDEFQKKYPQHKEVLLPAIFRESCDTLDIVVSAEQINETKTVKDLITLVSESIV